MRKKLLRFSVFLPCQGCLSGPLVLKTLALDGTMESGKKPCMCFVLFVFHEGQARLQLLLPPLPALGCAAFSLLEEEAASWPGLLGTFQASKTLARGPRDMQTGWGLVQLPKVPGYVLACRHGMGTHRRKSKSHLAGPPHLLWPQIAHFQKDCKIKMSLF